MCLASSRSTKRGSARRSSAVTAAFEDGLTGQAVLQRESLCLAAPSLLLTCSTSCSSSITQIDPGRDVEQLTGHLHQTIEYLLRRLGQQSFGDLLQGIEQPYVLDGDDGLGGQGLQQTAVLLAERTDCRTFQVEHALQPAAGADQGNGQLGTHGHLVVQRIVDARPGVGLQIGDTQRLAELGHPAHDTGGVDRQRLDRRPAQIAGHGGSHQLAAARVYQAKDAVVRAGHLQRHLQDRLQRIRRRRREEINRSARRRRASSSAVRARSACTRAI